MYDNTKGVKALGALLRQTFEVGEELTPEMQALLLRLARTETEDQCALTHQSRHVDGAP